MTHFMQQPGTGRTGMFNIPPNNYPFYSEDEKYKPAKRPDGTPVQGSLCIRAAHIMALSGGKHFPLKLIMFVFFVCMRF